MKRICMVAYTYYKFDPRVIREAECLVTRNDSVDFISLRKPGQSKRENLNGVNIIRINMGKYRGSNPLFYILSYVCFFIKATLILFFRFLIKKYHIVHIHTMPDFLVFVSVLPKLLGAKVILDIHDLVPELYMSKFKLKADNFLIRLLTLIEKWSIGFAHKAIAVHKPHLEVIINHGNPEEKFITLLNVPDPKVFITMDSGLKKDKDETVFIYHGTISKRHGLETAILAIARLVTIDNITGIKYRIIGEGDDLERIISLSHALGLSEYIYFSKAMIPLHDIVREIENADVGVISILNDEFTQYMLPTKLLEYVFLHKPVICARTHTIQTYFDESMVMYFTSGDEFELAKCLKFMHYNPQKRKELAENANRFTREYNWDKQKHIYYNLVDSLTQKNVRY